MFYSLKKILLDCIYPQYCVLCATEHTILCQRCESLICEKRTLILDQPTANLDYVIIGAEYDSQIQKVIHAFKYSGCKDLAMPLGTLLRRALRESHRPTPDTIIPIPLHRRKLIQRDYNQSELLARQVTAGSQQTINLCLRRTRATKPQARLTERERKQNVNDIFSYAGPPAYTVLLLDDVATTLSTLDSAARELKKHGATTVGALVIAKTKH